MIYFFKIATLRNELLLLICILCPLFVGAQQPDFRLPELDNKPFTYEIQLKDAPEVDGTREAYIQGITESQPLQFSVKGLGYALFPVTITILSADPGQELDIAFVKQHWGDTVGVTGTTNGSFQDHFKVAMEFGFKIQSKSPGVKFNIAVWVGKEMKLKPAHLFFPAAEYKDNSAASSSSPNDEQEATARNETSDGNTSNVLLIIICITLGGILILMAVLIWSKIKRKTLLLLLILTLPGFVQAGARPSSFQNFKEVYELFQKVNEMSDKLSALESAAEAWREYSGADQKFEPEMDPRGMPRLPSSCLRQWPGSDSNSSSDRSKSNDSGENDNEDAKRDGGEDKDDRNDYDNDRKESNGPSYDSKYQYKKPATRRDSEGERKSDKEESDKTIGEQDSGDRNGEGGKLNVDRKDRKKTKPGSVNDSRDKEYGDDKKYDDDQKEDDDSRERKERPSDQKRPTNDDLPPSGPDRDDNSEGCQCLKDAYDVLNELRYKFEKLKIIYKTTKDMTDKAIAFGDGTAPITGIAQFAWQDERIKILESLKGLEKAYDNKHAEFVDDLYTNLRDISDCESRLGFEQWYDKVGFIYFEFMRSHYERND